VTRPGTVLVLYHRPSLLFYKDAATVREHIHSFKRFSRFPVWEINTEFGFPSGLDEVAPGAVILHYSMFGSGSYRLGGRFLDWLRRRPDTLKVAFFQDEFYFCQKRFGFVNEFGIDIVFTHVSPQHIPEVWGRYTPGARAVFNLPGYVDAGLIAAARRFALPEEGRDIDVAYRGRALPPHMGAGSQEKRVIGERFKELAAATSLRVDIETSEESRLYGDAWYRLLGRSRATLGVESGVSFMDLEDECHAEYLRYRQEGREPTLEQLQAGALGRWDGNIPYRTLGPRHFEAAAFRICQVLFEGEYSGAIEPMVHYVPLAKDFSNFDEVVATIQDPERRRRITDRAHEDLIASGRYGYAGLIELVDRELTGAGLSVETGTSERAALSRAVSRGQRRKAATRWSMSTLTYLIRAVRGRTGQWLRRRRSPTVTSA
jgi:hypothetical protein